MRWNIAALPVTLALSGCVTMASSDLDTRSASAPVEGVAYQLPMALVTASLTMDPNALFGVTIEPLSYVGEGSTYLLQHRGSIFASDVATITSDVTTGLLQSVSIDSDDRFSEVAANAGKSVGAISAESATAAAREVAKLTADPASPTAMSELSDALTRALNAAADRELTESSASGATALTPARRAALQRARRAKLDIALSWLSPPSAPARDVKADCQRGVCVRQPYPAVLSVRLDGVLVSSRAIVIPNDSPAILVPFSRTAFADKKVTLTLVNGMVSSLIVDKKSEAEGAVLLPATFLGAAAGAATGAYTEKAKGETERQKFEDARRTRAAAEASASAENSAGDTGELMVVALPGLSLPESATGGSDGFNDAEQAPPPRGQAEANAAATAASVGSSRRVGHSDRQGPR